MFRWIDQTRHRHRLLGVSLLALQGALLANTGTDTHVAFVLIHFALVLLWQPFWQGSTRVNRGTAIATIAVGVTVVLWTSWALLSLWLLILLGIVGGEQTRERRDQLVQWLVSLYLLITLHAGIVPRVFGFEEIEVPAMHYLVLAATGIPFILMFINAGETRGGIQRFDYLRSLSITLLTLLLICASVLWTYRSGTAYPLALIQTLLFVGVLILAVNWLWQRTASHTMFQVLWNRYLLNVGTPFEHYLISLSGPAARGLEPDDYLDQAIGSMQELDWIAGVEARGVAEGRLAGTRTPHATESYDDVIPLIIYTRQDPGPALRLHIQLLARLVQQLFHSRLHEMELRNQEKARAVYETGARLTHDIKNLLQSLQSLSAAVGATPADRSDDTAELVRRQLPHINQRLQATLEKLRDPGEADHVERVALTDWWAKLQGRYSDEWITFSGEAAADVTVPRELVDTVAENLLENARYKQADEPELTIRVELHTDNGCVRLRISDSGSPIPDRVARYLFGGAVPSSRGLGVGLYQCARLATFHGFRLRLDENRPGTVTFLLEGPVQAAES